MKVTLIASVTANGQVLLAEHNTQVNTPQEVFGVFVQKSIEAKNIIMGRATYDMIMSVPPLRDAFSAIEIVILSKKGIQNSTHKVAVSPEEAIDYLKGKGFNNAIVAGGTHTYNAFLDKDLITDMFLSVVPVVIGNGGILGTKENTVLNFKLVDQKILVKDIVQLHFSKE